MPSCTEGQKRAELLELAKMRQAERLPPHCNLADFHDGYYECPFVSPLTISAQNVNASLMLILQDWSSSDALNGPKHEETKRLGLTYNFPTNRTLRRLLQHMNLDFQSTYATNLFPFIKRGALNANISTGDMNNCARRYAIPQIKIIAPKMVLCLGKATFDAVRSELGWPAILWKNACYPQFRTLLNNIEIFGVPHPGSRGIQNAGGMPEVQKIWKRLAVRLDELEGRPATQTDNWGELPTTDNLNTPTPTPTPTKRSAQKFAHDAIITVIRNPHRPGSQDHKLFNNLKDGQTVEEAIKKVRQYDLRWWATRGCISVS